MKPFKPFQSLFTVIALAVSADQTLGQGTAFTYQGRLTQDGAPATGTYSLRFILYGAEFGGSQFGPTLTNEPVAVSAGLFTTLLDFGATSLDGGPRWLEVAVRTNGSAAAHLALSPRQPLSSAPYAFFAANAATAASVTGTVWSAVTFANPNNGFAGSFVGDGSGLSNLNAVSLGGVAYSNFWQTGGNSGANPNWYLGTADYQPLELRVNNTRAVRITPTTSGWPNVIAGASNNLIQSDVTGANIGGGVNNAIEDTCGGSAIGGGRNNLVQTNAAGSFIGGGQWNVLGDGSVRSVIAGGYSNTIRGFTGTNAARIARDITDGTSNTILLGEELPGNATIGGGYANTIGSNCVAGVISGGEQNLLGDGSVRGVIGGGRNNTIRDGTANTIQAGELNEISEAHYAAIGGGRWNTNQGDYALIPGGAGNFAGGDYSFAAGRRARALHPGSFVWADAQDADFASTSDNQFSVRADGSVRFITAGAGMTLDGLPVLAGAVGPGQLSGTYSNAVEFSNPGNVFAGSFSGDGTGLANVDATTLGGLASSNFWQLGGNAGTTNTFLGTTDNQPLEFRVNNQRIWRLQPASISPNIVGGFSGNSLSNNARGCVIVGGGSLGSPNIIGEEIFPVVSSSIVGGGGQRITDDSGFIGGGFGNLIEGRYSSIAGGLRNRCDSIGRYSFIGGGQTNYIDSEFCFIGGGTNNQIDTFAWNSVITGGQANLIDAFATNSAIGGGFSNVVDLSASFATIPGGTLNLVDGKYGFAAGRRAKVRHQGAFIWADSTDADFSSTGNNQFLIRASGGMGLNVTRPRGELHVGLSSNVAPLNAASQTIIIEQASENGRAAFLALAGPGSGNVSNRVELELEANENERRAIIGTTSNHEIQIRQNNATRLTVWTNGFVGIGNTGPTNRLMVVNARCDGNSWINSSDRNLKENFAPVDARAVLEKVATLPITRWNYQDAPPTPHLGPVAQDFRAAFGLGADDTSIATVDADGVALAAIQGLNQKLEETVRQKQAEIEELKRRLEQVEKLISQLPTH